MKKIIISTLLIIVSVLVMHQMVYAANSVIFFSPASLTRTVGTAFNVSVQLNPSGNKACVVEGTLNFKNLSCRSITVASGLMTQTSPSCSDPTFVIGIPKCAVTSQGIFSVSVKGVKVGSAGLSLTGAKVIGAGVDVPFSVSSGSYTITAVKKVLPTPIPTPAPTPTSTPVTPPVYEPTTTPELPTAPTTTPPFQALSPLPPADSTCVGTIGTIGCGLVNNMKNGASIISTTTSKIKDVVQTPEGNAVTKTVGVAGIIAASTATLSTGVLFASPISFGELFLIPLRLWALIMACFGLKKKYLPWGTVYDSVTKQPLDPAYVVLKDEQGKEIATSITDMDGRYGFLVPKGFYYLNASKTHYTFPSQKLQGKVRDDLYTDLYFGEKIEVAADGAVIYKNIPMDKQGFDWNEFEKNQTGTSRHTYHERFWKHLSNFLFRLGFIIALLALLVAPEPYNYLIFGLYVVVILFRLLGFRPKVSGSIIDHSTGSPLSFAVISVYSSALGRELFKKVADQYGRYYILVPKGEYTVKISKKNLDESYTDVYTNVYSAKEGIINYAVRV